MKYLLIIFLAAGFCKSIFAKEIVMFCVGNATDYSYFRASKRAITNKYPNSKLALMVTNQIDSEVKFLQEKIYNQEKEKWYKIKIGYYVLSNNLDPQLFGQILNWMESEDQLFIKNNFSRETIEYHANFLLLPELLFDSDGGIIDIVYKLPNGTMMKGSL